MRTKRYLLMSAASIAMILPTLLGCGGASREFDVNTMPSDVKSAYDVFLSRCSKCHTPARPLNAPVESMSHWERYVTRMRRMPGSGISERDGDQILKFLDFYLHEIRGKGESLDANEGIFDEGGAEEEADTGEAMEGEEQSHAQ